MKTYSEKSIQTDLKVLKEWKFIKNWIEKNFKFLDFTQAVGFIVQVGLIAEKSNHRPELFNVYNKVTSRLTTHEAGGVTDMDIDLTKAIEKNQ